MSRRFVKFLCEGDRLEGTLDKADGTTGLLIVTGGNETRAGAFSGQSQLAARIALAGFPVFRFDRRGVGDSTGTNRGFTGSAADIDAAVTAFKASVPHLDRLVGFGNCDAATALMLARGAGCNGLVLANPWTFEGTQDSTNPPAAVRARYAEKLRNPRELLRLVTGKVSIRKLGKGIVQAARRDPPQSPMVKAMAAGIADFHGPTRFLIAERDRTGQAFLGSWNPRDPRILRCPDATHAFVEPQARDWLFARLCEELSA